MNTITADAMKRLSKTDMISVVGIAACFIVYLLLGAEQQAASPLALLIMMAAGWLLSLKWALAGSIILCFAGAALIVHPFMFSSSFLYAVFAAPVSAAGITGIINWWKQNGNNE